MTDKRAILIFTTAGSVEEARAISHALVERRHAACVNIVPHVESIYRWQGKVENAHEWLLVIKTTEEQFGRVREEIINMHSYEVPECISVAVTDGSNEYLRWLTDSVEQA